jgi:magnesium transporter
LTEEVFYLTELLGARAYFNGRRVGRLRDLVAVDRDEFAEVTHFQIGRPFGDAPLLVPLATVRYFDRREIVARNSDPASYVRPLQPHEVLLRDYLLDKKVLDTEGRELDIVYDIRLVVSHKSMYVTDVDISRYGLLRRIGLKRLAERLYQRAAATQKKLIPWRYVQPLPENLDGLEGDLSLSVLKEKLAEIHPADLADILEQLDSRQRARILERLDTEQASDTLEAIDPAVQRDIVQALEKSHVARLIGQMTPGQAADIVAVLPAVEKRAILGLLGPDQASKIQEILEKHEVNILNFATSRFLIFAPEMTVSDARTRYREAAKGADVRAYLYIVTGAKKLVGVVDARELLIAGDEDELRDLMVEKVISLRPESTMKQAADAFLRYGFRALPITDMAGELVGVVPCEDVMNLSHLLLSH